MGPDFRARQVSEGGPAHSCVKTSPENRSGFREGSTVSPQPFSEKGPVSESRVAAEVDRGGVLAGQSASSESVRAVNGLSNDWILHIDWGYG